MILSYDVEKRLKEYTLSLAMGCSKVEVGKSVIDGYIKYSSEDVPNEVEETLSNFIMDLLNQINHLQDCIIYDN